MSLPASTSLFPTLPDTARVWVFTADRPLDGAARERLEGALAAFLPAWTSHGRPVPADAALAEGRFLVVAAHIAEGDNAGVSGCGIDALTHAVEAAARSAGFAWLDGLHVGFRDARGAVTVLPRPAVRALAREGRVTAETPIFDTTIAALGPLRKSGLERPAHATWLARAFRLGQPA